MYIHPNVLEQLSQRYKADMQEQALASRRRGRASTGASRVARGWSLLSTRLRRRSRLRTVVLHPHARPWRAWRATAVPHD
jgi:hypothetical protein